MKIEKNFLGLEVVLADREKEALSKPHDYREDKKPPKCPFCIIEENEQNRIIYNKGVIVIPNKFPFVEESYVVVHKEHNGSLDDPKYALEIEEAVKFMYRRAMKLDRYLLLFKNKGYLAGASLEHAHEQIVLVERNEKPYKDETKIAEFLENELSRNDTKINEYSFCPSVSIRSYETIVVLEGKNLLSSKTWDRISIVFSAMKKVLWKDFDYNLVLHYSEEELFPPFVQIIPRYSPLGGLEIALGRFVNPILPENAAKRIKNALRE